MPIGTYTLQVMIPLPDGNITLRTVYTESNVTPEEAKAIHTKWLKRSPELESYTRGTWTGRIIF